MNRLKDHLPMTCALKYSSVDVSVQVNSILDFTYTSCIGFASQIYFAMAKLYILLKFLVLPHILNIADI
jgi:hypothetical protein